MAKKGLLELTAPTNKIKSAFVAESLKREVILISLFELHPEDIASNFFIDFDSLIFIFEESIFKPSGTMKSLIYDLSDADKWEIPVKSTSLVKSTELYWKA